MSFLSALLGNPPKEAAETRALLERYKQGQAESALPDDDATVALLSAVMEAAGEEVQAAVGMRIGQPVFALLNWLLTREPFGAPVIEDCEELSLVDGADYRNRLREAERMRKNEDYFLGKWQEVMAHLLAGFYREFPEQAFVDPDEHGRFEEYSRLSPSAPLYTYVKDMPTLVHYVIGTVFAKDLVADGLFNDLRDQLLINLCNVSGIPVENRYNTVKKFVMPEDFKGDAGQLVQQYLRHTPFLDLFLAEIPLCIPEAVRFEHTYILAGTGHGKTQTLQFLIAGDLEAALRDKRSLVVMDSQGDLLQTLMRSDYFADPLLRDRFIYIDPTDMERPVGLNLFDVDISAGGQADAVARETILNNTIELYDFFFGALLGAELTQKQGLVFRYLAVLMMKIPGANIHTLRELMENGEKFRPCMAQLGGSARAFFETRFFDKAFNETKKQVLNRLWGVLSNQTLDRMMSAPKNTVDLYSKLQDGSVVFINTAKDFFGEEGSAIFSRMFVALLSQAFMRRAAVPKHERTPTYVYIDEAERVIDPVLNRALAQIRKYKGAVTFAHQNLDQVEPGIRAGVMANTSIKLAGGISAKDASALAPEFRTNADFLLDQKRTKTETAFACFAKNVTDQAVSLSIPLGYLESRLSADEGLYRELIEESRQKYGVVYVETPIPAEEPKDSPSDWLAPAAGIAAEPPAHAAPPQEAPLEIPPLPHVHVAAPLASVLPAEDALEDDSAVQPAPTPIVLPPAPREMGGGGAKHKCIEHLIKELGEERGFRAAIEEPIHDGAGRVDVILRRGELALAFEISVTTTRDHELENVEKCLAASFAHVALVTSNARRHKSLSSHIAKALDDEERKRVSFLLPEDLPGFLDSHMPAQPPAEKTVKGYTVRSRIASVDSAETQARRRAVAAVVARSLSS